MNNQYLADSVRDHNEIDRLRKALREIVALQDRSFVSGEGLFIRAITIARKALKPAT